jgi:hypothetical protein
LFADGYWQSRAIFFTGDGSGYRNRDDGWGGHGFRFWFKQIE